MTRSTAPILDANGNPVNATLYPPGREAAADSFSVALSTEDKTTLDSIAGITVPKHDYVALGYTGDNLTTVTYKTGGSGGTTVATLTLAYSGSTLTSITRS